VLVDEGDRVTKGQLLARMDTRTLEASRKAESEVLRARQNLAANEANVQLRQSEKLLASQELKRVPPTGPARLCQRPATRPATSAF
jgi:HlyD family secretion protein